MMVIRVGFPVPAARKTAKEKAGFSAGLRGYLWGIEPYLEHIKPTLPEASGGWGAENRYPLALPVCEATIVIWRGSVADEGLNFGETMINR